MRYLAPVSLESTALFLLIEHRAERAMHSLLLNTLIRHARHHIVHVTVRPCRSMGELLAASILAPVA
jgi:hypothetical protein